MTGNGIIHPPPPPSGPVGLDKGRALSLLRDMLRIRRMEEHSAELYGEGKIRGFLHLYIGEEAVGTGALNALSPEDNVVATYREHGHALLHGIPMKTIMAELYGKVEGCSRGHGGSMHLFDARRRFFGGSAIVGGGLPLAVGLALADVFKARDAVTACFFGEGAMAEGVFHESMNLAALWRLPVLFCCENNLYAMGTALARSESQTDLAAKAAAYKVPAVSIDGMDVSAVYEAVLAAREAVIRSRGPMFVEFRTYRFRAHSMYDAELYREKGEVEEWKTLDPIDTFKARLTSGRMLSAKDLRDLEREVDAEVREAIVFAEAGTWEPVTDLLNDVYTPRSPG